MKNAIPIIVVFVVLVCLVGIFTTVQTADGRAVQSAGQNVSGWIFGGGILCAVLLAAFFWPNHEEHHDEEGGE
jgi:NO-binding membrane sensor protein with MHYT domain